MRSSLIVLALALASLHLARTALARRIRRAALVPTAKGGASAALDVSELSLVEGVTVGGGAAAMRGSRVERGATARGDAASSRFADESFHRP